MQKKIEPSIAVLEAVSEAKETCATELPPLYEVVDPDALDRIFSDRRTSGSVTFQYAGYTVSARSDRTIEIVPAPDR